MSNDFIGQILGSVLGSGSASSGSADGTGSEQGLPGGLGGLGGLLGGLGGGGGGSGAGGGLGGVLGSILGGRAGQQDAGGTGASPSMGGQGALLAMLLPLAMQWVQRNGGIGAVLDRFKQQGYGQQAASWVSTGANQEVDPQAVTDVVGADELSRLAQQIGVPQEQVASGMAQILPQVVNHLTPAGDVPQDADDVLGAGLASLERLLGGQRAAGG